MHSPSGCSYVGILVVRLSYLNLEEQKTVHKKTRPGENLERSSEIRCSYNFMPEDGDHG